MRSIGFRDLIVAALFSSGLAAAYPYSYFFNDTNGLGPNVANISMACNSALIANIPTCDPYFKWILQSDTFGPLGNESFQSSICNNDCLQGLNGYRSAVISACARDPDPFPGLPATYWVDATVSAFNTTCLKDINTGEFCTDYTGDIFSNSDEDWTSLNSTVLCSSCVVNLFRHMQSTSYSNYDANLAAQWKSIQSACQISYPTELPSLQTNVTDVSNLAPPGSGYNGGCLSGKNYTVVPGDNCETIAERNDVATGTLIAINDLLTDCTDLQGGQTICLPPNCTTYEVQSGDTCISVANTTNTLFQQIISWNPTLNSWCTNLVSGQRICVSPPGGTRALSTIAGATVTTTAVYATMTAAPPNPIASGTTRKCGQYYQVQTGDFCQLISVNKSIDLGLFLAINPSINSTCGNILPGAWYCVQPTSDWNNIASSTIASAPTTTPSGTTADCYGWYVIKSGDYCSLIENSFGITFQQLQYWNPSLLDDCSNLLTGEAYCISGASEPKGALLARGDFSIRRTVAPPQQTQMGGVPVGWPYLNAPRVIASMAAAKRNEL